jgi:hypothetical protein
MVICSGSGGYPGGNTLVEHPAGQGFKSGQYFAHGRSITQKQPQSKVTGYPAANFTLFTVGGISNITRSTFMAKEITVG